MDFSELRSVRQAVEECQDIVPGLSEAGLRGLVAHPEKHGLVDVVVRYEGRIFLKISPLRERLAQQRRRAA